MVALTLREVGARMRGDVRVLLEDQWEALQERGGPNPEALLAMQKEVETFPDAGDFAVKLDRYNFRASRTGVQTLITNLTKGFSLSSCFSLNGEF